VLHTFRYCSSRGLNIQSHAIPGTGLAQPQTPHVFLVNSGVLFERAAEPLLSRPGFMTAANWPSVLTT